VTSLKRLYFFNGFDLNNWRVTSLIFANITKFRFVSQKFDRDSFSLLGVCGFNESSRVKTLLARRISNFANQIIRPLDENLEFFHSGVPFIVLCALPVLLKVPPAIFRPAP